MGLDVHSMLVVGEKVIKKYIEKEITKYNENTGQPYKIKISEDVWVFESGDLCSMESESDESDIEIHTCCYEEDSDFAVYGFLLHYTKSHRDTLEPEIVDMEKSSDLLTQYKLMIGRSPRIYIMTYWSC